MEVGPLRSDFHSIPYSVMALLIHPDPRGRTVTLLAPRVPNSRSTLARKVGSRTKPFYRSHLTTFPYTRSSHTFCLCARALLTLPQHGTLWTRSNQARRQREKARYLRGKKRRGKYVREFLSACTGSPAHHSGPTNSSPLTPGPTAGDPDRTWKARCTDHPEPAPKVAFLN